MAIVASCTTEFVRNRSLRAAIRANIAPTVNDSGDFDENVTLKAIREEQT
jgi:hypothetical protein